MHQLCSLRFSRSLFFFKLITHLVIGPTEINKQYVHAQFLAALQTTQQVLRRDPGRLFIAWSRVSSVPGGFISHICEDGKGESATTEEWKHSSRQTVVVVVEFDLAAKIHKEIPTDERTSA